MNAVLNLRRSAIRIAVFSTVPAVLLLLAVYSQCAVGEESNYGLEVDEVAKQAVVFLEKKNENHIAVGEWTGSTASHSSSGPAIKQALIDALEHHTLTIDPKASFTIKGDYLTTIDKESGLLALKLSARMLDSKTGEEAMKFAPRAVFQEKDIIRTIGLTASLTPADSPTERNSAIRKSLDNPSVAIDSMRIKSTADSLYGVEILVKPGVDDASEPRQPKDVDGMAFVAIKRSEYYEVRVVNDSDHDAAVSASIDGIDQFAFSDIRDEKTGKPRYSYWIVPKKSSFPIKGWHISNKQLDSFQVTEFAKSEAGKLLRPESTEIGTITVTFRAAWAAAGDRPSDEGESEPGKGTDSDATGRGPPIQIDVKEAERTVGKIRSSVSVRYTTSQ